MNTTLTEPQAQVRAALTAQDRCDRCGAQAYLAVEVAPGMELLFCAHHTREHRDKLKETGAVIVRDETKKLEAVGKPAN